MKKRKLKASIDWKSKIMDLLIVVIGITIAFNLNTWNLSIETNSKVKGYNQNFSAESKANQEDLSTAIAFSEESYKDIDTLKNILLSKRYSDGRILLLTSRMMSMATFTPSTTTMENIKASGDFDLIKEMELRESIINTYNFYETTANLENLLSDYINQYITPFFFENVRFSNFSSIHSDFVKEPTFENIVIGYEILLKQLINGYRVNKDLQEDLNEKLNSFDNP